MKREDLLAPLHYNLVSEIERFATGEGKTAVQYLDAEGLKKTISYDDLIHEANKMANVFKLNGLQKGDVMIVMVPRLVEAYITYIAAIKSGLVVIPSSEMLRTKDIEYRIEHSSAKAVVSYEPYISQFDDVKNLNTITQFVIGEGQPHGQWIPLIQQMEEVDAQFDIVNTRSTDTAFLSYTSGTTGNPKAAVHTHAWAFAHLRTAAPHWLGINEGDIVWATASPGWQKWIWSPFLSVLGSGATGFVYNSRFDAETYLKLIKEYKVNVLCCTPTEYRVMAKVDHLASYDLSSLHSAVSAGEPLNVEVINRFKNTFDIQVRDGYGQTENTLLIGTMKGMAVKLGSMGKPTPGNDVVIIDEFGQVCASGIVGDIAIHRNTPALFKEYFKDPERTQKQYRGDYYVTGDQAKMDEDGYFWFEGRSDDIIISSGYTIGPFEVEDALVKHADVSECAVIGSPDEIRGSIVKAFVILRNKERANDAGFVKELQNFVKELTAPYKYPRAIEFVDELPKTASGKIRRIELREAEQQ
ncbi:acyl-CoA synthetase MbcS [Kurthia sibirica]|uniref:Acyl--CoA ligase n=1 Tax=Kurthia sibirica TaxID=202750 RepID=A0A2U3ANU1_9BACL|nr:acyl--CoA ligase [Kurthia sibirica]PWI26220.1 acyl--CoA ligase [Kurthia sibirica]GEK34734.1 acyl--CoA ligase [Kurthia sibirica]